MSIYRQGAIVRGATLRGLAGIEVLGKKSRRHYGFAMEWVFRENIDPESKAAINPSNGIKYCRERAIRLISKVRLEVHVPTNCAHIKQGQLMDENFSMTRDDFDRGNKATVTLNLIGSDDDIAPEWSDDSGKRFPIIRWPSTNSSRRGDKYRYLCHELPICRYVHGLFESDQWCRETLARA